MAGAGYSFLPMMLIIICLSTLSTTGATKMGKQSNQTMAWKYRRMCYGIDYPRVCVSIAEKYNTSRRIDIGRRMLDELTMQASSTLKFARREQKKHKKNSLPFEMAGVCCDEIDNMDTDLKIVGKCLKFKNGSRDDIGNSLSGLHENLRTCNEAYSERNFKSPFKENITHMTEIIIDLFWIADKYHMLKRPVL